MASSLIEIAEAELRHYAGDVTRETAATLLPVWWRAFELDDDARAQVLDRFALGEPLMVAGRDYLLAQAVLTPDAPELPAEDGAA